jgi:amino acid transporter
MPESAPPPTSLRRDLGRLESYAVLIGILVGAGIFKVTSDASDSTGPSVILGHLLLAPAVLASSVAYVVFLSTSLGREPGGEALHIARTFGRPRVAFVCGWLKLISYTGAGAYLADALSVNLIELVRPGDPPALWAQRLVGLAALTFFFAVHYRGVRWFGKLQVGMCLVLAVAIVVLVIPGLLAVKRDNFRPFFTGGFGGFAISLPPLFFAYAGFEALAQTAGEVRDSSRVLPRVFFRGILLTTLIFLSMSIVAFGVLPAKVLSDSEVPMSLAASEYLPFGASAVVTVGAIMAIATSLNATLLVPARLAWNMAREGLVPPAFGTVHSTRGTPVVGLGVTFVAMAALLLSGQLGLALGIAVVSLVSLYLFHSIALLALPRWNPELYAQVSTTIPRGVQVIAGWCSVLAMGAIVVVQFRGDLAKVLSEPWMARVQELDLTSLELLVVWGMLGAAAMYIGLVRKGRAQDE